MTVILATHGKRLGGLQHLDPPHTSKGIEQLLASFWDFMCLYATTGRVKKIVVGDAQKFMQIYALFCHAFPRIPVTVSMFLGTKTSRISPGVMNTEFGAIPYDKYEGISNVSAFHPWELLESYPEDTVAYSGSQFMEALGYRAHSASLFKITPKDRKIICLISQGSAQPDLYRFINELNCPTAP